MSTTAALFLLLAGVVLAGVVALVVRRRRIEREARRVDALRSVAERVDAAMATLGDMTVIRSFDPVSSGRPDPAVPAPIVHDGLPGRTGLLDAVDSAVEHARAEGSRLSVAVVRAGDGTDAGVLASVVREVAGAPVFAVGPRSVAFVLGGLGRAEALGLLARIESRCVSSGRAVELEAGEGATELVARLLAGPRPAGE